MNPGYLDGDRYLLAERVPSAAMKSMKLPAILVALGTAVLFEALTLLATQDKVVRVVSPWQDDPYDVLVSFAMLLVPVLALAIALRLPAWQAPGGSDRGHQTVRAAGTLITLTGLTLAAEWAAVIAGAHAQAWNGWTKALIAGLAALSLLTLAAAAGLWRQRSPRRAARGWRHDWLGDIALIGRRIPFVGRWATPGVVEWVRTHATAVFVTVSLLAAAGVIGAQAIGEGWTDPLLIAWATIVVATASFAFCLITNAAAGFIARPPRTRAAHVAETSVIVGTAALLLTTAFRDPLWSAVADTPVASVRVLVTLTLGTGLAASLITCVLLSTRRSRDAR
jgi:hypothetical protein